jgi:hypothetical protein
MPGLAHPTARPAMRDHATVRAAPPYLTLARKGAVTGATAQCGPEWERKAMAQAIIDDCPPLDVTLTDRRRPGRVDYQDAQLVALLRGEPTDAIPATAEVDLVPKIRWTDDPSPARGILIAMPIGAAMWAAIVFDIWLST